MKRLVYWFTLATVLPAVALLASRQADAQVYYNYNHCPVGMVQSYDPVYQNYTCYYPSNYGVTYSRPNISLGFYWGSNYAPYRYPSYHNYRYPYYRNSYRYQPQHGQPQHGHPGHYR